MRPDRSRDSRREAEARAHLSPPRATADGRSPPGRHRAAVTDRGPRRQPPSRPAQSRFRPARETRRQAPGRPGPSRGQQSKQPGEAARRNPGRRARWGRETRAAAETGPWPRLALPPLGLHLRGRRLRRACDAPAAEERVLRLIVSDPQTGVAPGWTRGRKVRSKCR